MTNDSGTEVQPLTVACVGAGYFAQLHYASWARFPALRILGACDRDLAKAEATGFPAFSDLGAMLEAGVPDILDIILPPSGHAEAIRAGLAAGVTAIICQKPFCSSLEEAKTVTAEAAAAGIPLIVHENFRFQPWYRAMSEALGQGRIGTVLNAVFRLRPGDGQGPHAYLDRQPYFQTMERFLIHETAVHWIDTFRFLFGPIRSVYADLRRINPAIAGEDAGLVIFEHDGGVRSVFDGNRHLDHASDNQRRTMGEALIEGTGGALTLAGSGAVGLRRFTQTTEQRILPPDRFDGFGGDCVHHLNAHVVNGLRDGSGFENLAEDYLHILAVEAAIYASSETGQKTKVPTP